MPRGDRSGPDFMGPMTGRGAGYCAGYGMPGFANRFEGGRYGRGRGFGFRHQRGWTQPEPMFSAPALSKEQEAAMLSRQSEYLESELKEIRERLQNLNADTDK